MLPIRSLVLMLPLIELVLLIVLGAFIGAWPTIGIILGTGVVGFTMLAITRRTRFPAQPGTHGAMRVLPGGALALSGVLLLIPGVLTDVLGLVLLVPAPRRWLMDRGQRWMFQRVTGMDMRDNPLKEAFEAAQRAQEAAAGMGTNRPAGGPIVIDAEVTAVRDDPA